MSATASSPSVPDVSAVIVAARDGERLATCLAHLRAAEPELELDVIVVLNDASEGVAEAAEAADPKARLVRSDVGLGFAGGVNLGARWAEGRHVLILHDDALPEPGAISLLVAALAADPRAGAAGPLVFDLDGVTPQTAGHVLWRDARTTPPWLSEPPPAPALVGPRAVDYCSSAALLVRDEAWRAAGGLDDDLHPAQYVDVDLAMRLRAAGYVVVCEPAARVRHARGGTAGRGVRRVAWARNRERFARRWAKELGAHEHFAHDADGLARAQSATERLASEARARPLKVPPARLGPPPEHERIARDQAARVRQRAFDAACRAELDCQSGELEALRAMVADRDGRLSAASNAHAELHGELERVSAAHAIEVGHRVTLQGDVARFEAQIAKLEQRLADLALVVPELERRSATLDAIISGRWWRLRRRFAVLERRVGRGR